MELTHIKSDIIRKYTEHKQFLSGIDFFSNITGTENFSFRTSQQGYRYLKGKGLHIVEERVSAGRMAIIIEIDTIKLDDFTLNKIEIVQDIEVKVDKLYFLSGAYTTRPEFHTRNQLGQKDISIFDIKKTVHHLIFRIQTGNNEFIECMTIA